MNSVLEKAIVLATQKHSGEVRWNGEPYILHPIRVMMKMNNIDEKIVAVLHDIFENTSTTTDELKTIGCSDLHINNINILTNKKIKPYLVYIRDISENRMCKTIKIADLTDNLDLFNLPKINNVQNTFVSNEHYERINKYLLALSILKQQ